MLVKSLALLLILVVVTESYNCTRPLPSNCFNHPNIKIGKGPEIYQIILCARQQCLSGGGITDHDIPTWINCRQVCDACNQIVRNRSIHNANCRNNTLCEKIVDSFLNDLCASLRVASTSTITTVDARTEGQMTVAKTQTSIIIALGALLGLFVVLLAVVSAVCMWMCLKQREVNEDSPTNKMATVSNDKRMQLTANPSYEVTKLTAN